MMCSEHFDFIGVLKKSKEAILEKMNNATVFQVLCSIFTVRLHLYPQFTTCIDGSDLPIQLVCYHYQYMTIKCICNLDSIIDISCHIKLSLKVYLFIYFLVKYCIERRQTSWKTQRSLNLLLPLMLF
jgi:hypothetical protein